MPRVLEKQTSPSHGDGFLSNQALQVERSWLGEWRAGRGEAEVVKGREEAEPSWEFWSHRSHCGLQRVGLLDACKTHIKTVLPFRDPVRVKLKSASKLFRMMLGM